MSNLSLKDQLQALSLGASARSSENEVKKPKKNKPINPKTKKQKPVWLEQAQYGVELLKAHFPMVFKENKDIRPLKIGIKQDLVKRLSTREDIVIGDKACMVSSLAYYVNSLAYHKSVVEGAARIDLDGSEAGTVAAQEAQYSLEYRKAKLTKGKPTQQPVSENVNTSS